MKSRVEKMKWVLFDLGKVLADNDVERFCRMLCAESDLTAENVWAEYAGETMPALETGAMSFADYVAHYRRRWNLPWDETAWIDRYASVFSPNPLGRRVRELCTEVGAPTAVLSNTAEYNIIALEQSAPEVLRGHAASFYSYELGLHKPDPAIYHAACEQLAANPEEILFLDDNAENVLSARAVGMKAIQFNDDNAATIINVIRDEWAL